MKVYIAVNTEMHEGAEIESYNLGVFTSKEKAIEILERQAKDDLGMFEEEDQEDFERSDFESGNFTLTNGYDVYTYNVEEHELKTEE